VKRRFSLFVEVCGDGRFETLGGFTALALGGPVAVALGGAGFDWSG